jgi:hypothetical protein
MLVQAFEYSRDNEIRAVWFMKQQSDAELLKSVLVCSFWGDQIGMVKTKMMSFLPKSKFPSLFSRYCMATLELSRKLCKWLIRLTLAQGFLGSGKTTLLNYILKENHGMKIAVVENGVLLHVLTFDMRAQSFFHTSNQWCMASDNSNSTQQCPLSDVTRCPLPTAKRS